MSRQNFCMASTFQKQLEHLNPPDRISHWCKFFEGFKYIVSPIEDDRSKLIRLDGFDCVTLVETVIALAKSDTFDQASDILRQIRYRAGIISWENRNHFTSIDWIPENIAFLKPLYSEKHRNIWIDRESFFSENGHKLPIELRKMVYISFPSINISNLTQKKLEKGVYMFSILSRRNWLMVDHVGFIIVDEQIRFCHASSLLGKVVIQDIQQFREQRKGEFDIAVFAIDF